MEKNAAHPEVRQEDQISSEQTDKQEGSKKRLERMQTENWRVLIGWMRGRTNQEFQPSGQPFRISVQL